MAELLKPIKKIFNVWLQRCLLLAFQFLLSKIIFYSFCFKVCESALKECMKNIFITLSIKALNMKNGWKSYSHIYPIKS